MGVPARLRHLQKRLLAGLLACALLILAMMVRPAEHSGLGDTELQPNPLPPLAAAPAVPVDALAAHREPVPHDSLTASESPAEGWSVRFVRESGGPLPGLRAVAAMPDGLRWIAAEGTDVIVFPEGCEEALALSEGTTPTLIDLRWKPREAFLRLAVRLRFRILDAETRHPLAGIEVRPVPPAFVSRTFPWLSAVTELQAAASITDEFGEGSLPYSLIRHERTEDEWVLVLQCTQLDEARVPKYGRQWIETHRVRPDVYSTGIKESFIEIPLPLLQEWTVDFVTEPGGISDGAQASIVMIEGAKKLTTSIDANYQARFVAPGTNDLACLERLTVDLGKEVRLFVPGECLEFPHCSIRFSRSVLPATGHVVLPETVGAPRLSVASYPLDPDPNVGMLERGYVLNRFPLQDVRWFPVDASGTFTLPTGWIGQSTAVLLRDDATRRVVTGAMLEPGQEAWLSYPGLGWLELIHEGGPLPAGLSLNLDPDHWYAPDQRIDLDDSGKARLMLLPGGYSVTALVGMRAFRLQDFVVHSGETTRSVVPAIGLMSLRVSVVGSISGPLHGAHVWVTGGPRLVTNSAGVAEAEVLTAAGELELYVPYPCVGPTESLVHLSRTMDAGEGEVEIRFDEGTVRFQVPAWVNRTVPRDSCVVRLRVPGMPGIVRRFPSEGVLSFRLPAGRYEANVDAPGLGSLPYVAFDIPAQGEVAVDFAEIDPRSPNER